MVDSRLPIVESHFYKVSQNTFPTAVHMHECTNTSTHIHTDTLINYTTYAALDIPMETCVATSNVPTSRYKMYHVGNIKFTQIQWPE